MENRIWFILICISTSTFCVLSSCRSQQLEVWTKPWPKVSEIDTSFQIDNAKTASLSLYILGENGKPLYNLQGHNDLYGGDPDFDYSGEFECRLVSLYSLESYSTLLTENPRQDRDWDHRARYFAYQVFGDCAEYPDYGAVRQFRLRGMLITLEMKDVTFIKQFDDIDSTKIVDLRLNSFTFSVSVKSEPSATTGIAEPTKYAGPPVIYDESNNYRSYDCSEVRLRTSKELNQSH